MNRPSGSQACAQGGTHNAEFSCPVFDYLSLSIQSKHSVSSCIARLFSRCGPDTVFWAIRAVVIDAFNGMLRRWPWSHVCQEFSEVLAPFVAYSDASAAPSWVFLGLESITAIFHFRPRSVFRTTALAVCQRIGKSGFRLPASATQDSGLSQVLASIGRACATITAAMPHHITVLVRGTRQHGQSAEPLTSQIHQFHSEHYMSNAAAWYIVSGAFLS